MPIVTCIDKPVLKRVAYTSILGILDRVLFNTFTCLKFLPTLLLTTFTSPKVFAALAVNRDAKIICDMLFIFHEHISNPHFITVHVLPTPSHILFLFRDFPSYILLCLPHSMYMFIMLHTSLCTVCHVHIFPIPPHTSFMFFQSLVRDWSYSYMPLPFLTHCSCSHTTHPSSDTVHVHILPILTYCSCSYTSHPYILFMFIYFPSLHTVHVHILPILTYCSCSYTSYPYILFMFAYYPSLSRHCSCSYTSHPYILFMFIYFTIFPKCLVLGRQTLINVTSCRMLELLATRGQCAGSCSVSILRSTGKALEGNQQAA